YHGEIANKDFRRTARASWDQVTNCRNWLLCVARRNQLNEKYQTATGIPNNNDVPAMTNAPSQVNKPAANNAMTAEAMEPDVGISSMKGMKSVSAMINASGK